MRPAGPASIFFGSERGPTISITFGSGRDEPRQAYGVGSARMSRMRTIVGILLAVLLLPGLGASGIPRVAPPQFMVSFLPHDMPLAAPLDPAQVSREVHLEAVAQAYYTCMSEANVPVYRTQDPQRYWTMVEFSVAGTIMRRDLKGNSSVSMYYTSGASDVLSEAVLEFMYIPDARPALILNQTDYTDVYVKCLRTSGYDQGTVDALWTGSDPVETQHWNDLRRQATAAWISCAHRNGWPGIPDVGPDSSVAVLPSTMTDDQLRRLLEACPSFDKENALAQLAWSTTNPGGAYPEEVIPDPTLTIQVTGLTAAYPPGWMPEAERRVVANHIARLYEILSEQSLAFFEQYHPE